MPLAFHSATNTGCSTVSRTVSFHAATSPPSSSRGATNSVDALPYNDRLREGAGAGAGAGSGRGAGAGAGGAGDCHGVPQGGGLKNGGVAGAWAR